MKSKISHLCSLKAWLGRKRKSFSSPYRRYQHLKSKRKGRGSLGIASDELTTAADDDDDACHAQKTQHDDGFESSSSLSQTLVQSNDSRSVSSSENTSCLKGSRGLTSPTRDTQLDRHSALSFLKKGNELCSFPGSSPPENNNQTQNPRDSSSLASDDQSSRPQDLSSATNDQPWNSHAIPSPENDGEIKSYLSSTSHDDTPSCSSQARANGLVNLPYTLFLKIFCLVPPHEIVRSRQVSKALRDSLTSQALSMSLILAFFPQAREARILRGLAMGEDCPEMGDNSLNTTDWATVFARLARRYRHLSQGKVWRQHEIVIRNDLQASHGVKPWNRLLHGHNLWADFHHWDPFWTCAPDQGLIIYPAANSESLDLLEFRARDIEMGDECVVPFRISGGSLIRVHVSDGVLLFAFVTKFLAGFRIFIEAFDVEMEQPILPQLNSNPNNKVREKRLSQRVFSSRGRFQIFSSMGRPLGHEGRSFCTHNSTHFALYNWFPTTDPAFVAVNPLEELIVWDIGSPQQGPRPERSEPRRTLTHRTSFLQHLGLSQKFTPRLRRLELDKVTQDHDTGSSCGHVYLVEDDHDLLVGPHSGPSSGLGHCVQSTGIPLSGVGPMWKEMCLGKAPDTSMNFSRLHSFSHARYAARGSARWQRIQRGHIAFHDSCSSGPQCWRHESFPYITLSQAHDTAAGVRFKASQFFGRKVITVSFPPGIYPYHSDKRPETPCESHSLMNEDVSFFWGRFDSLMAKGRIYGDERWLIGEDKNGHLNVLRF